MPRGALPGQRVGTRPTERQLITDQIEFEYRQALNNLITYFSYDSLDGQCVQYLIRNLADISPEDISDIDDDESFSSDFSSSSGSSSGFSSSSGSGFSSGSSGSSESTGSSQESRDIIIFDAITSLNAHYFRLHEHFRTTRVLNPRPKAPRFSHFSLLWWFEKKHEQNFRRIVRVSPPVFAVLVSYLESTPLFRPDPKSRRILNTKEHLAIFMKRAGHYGNGASIAEIAEWAGVSTGTVVNVTWRVQIAFMYYHDEQVRWPNAQEKRAAKEFTVARTCNEWNGAFLAVDGTAIKLFQKPALFGESWYNKDSIYAMSLQV